MTDLEARILNPGVILVMILAGLAYARVLWRVNLRPTSVLLFTALRAHLQPSSPAPRSTESSKERKSRGLTNRRGET